MKPAAIFFAALALLVSGCQPGVQTSQPGGGPSNEADSPAPGSTPAPNREPDRPSS